MECKQENTNSVKPWFNCNHPVDQDFLSINDEEKIEIIEQHFEEILKTLGLDLNNDSLQKTPYRFAKMIVKELFEGLQGKNYPKITVQNNSFGYHDMLIETNISIKSVCEHHFMPILGYCHIAYIPKEKIIGLSKLNRIAQYFAKRPQVQERMSNQIRDNLRTVLNNDSIAVCIDAIHLCVRMRGIQDVDSLTRTMAFSGEFENPQFRQEFLNAIPKLNDTKI